LIKLQLERLKGEPEYLKNWQAVQLMVSVTDKSSEADLLWEKNTGW
jgi:hypothetical protein